MLFEKKQPTKENEKEKRLTALFLKVIEEETELKRQTEKVIIRKGVIDLYPDGADYKAAEDFKYSQQCLVNQIAFYEDMRQTFINMLIKYQAEGVGLGWNKPLTSHEIVEKTYKDFFKKG